MIKYSDDYENKRELIVKLVNDLYKNKKDNEAIIRVIYESANTKCIINEDNEKINRVKETTFTNLSTKELLKLFNKENFFHLLTPAKKKESLYFYENLLQEVYNRQAKENNCEPKNLVFVRELTNPLTLGYTTFGKNDLFINRLYLDLPKYIRTENKLKVLGGDILKTLIHETQHTIQHENIMKFAINDLQDDREKFIACLNIARYAFYSTPEGEKHYKDNYKFDMMEHDANIAPIKYIMNKEKNGDFDNFDVKCLYANKEKSRLDIQDINDTKSLNKRTREMEKVINDYRKYINSLPEGEITNKVRDTLNDYMKKDKKGNSKFKDLLKKDFEISLAFIKQVEEQKSQNNSMQNV